MQIAFACLTLADQYRVTIFSFVDWLNLLNSSVSSKCISDVNRMTQEDFCKFYSDLDICCLCPDFLDGDSSCQWKTSFYEGRWVAGTTAGGCMNNPGTSRLSGLIQNWPLKKQHGDWMVPIWEVDFFLFVCFFTVFLFYFALYKCPQQTFC